MSYYHANPELDIVELLVRMFRQVRAGYVADGGAH